MEEKKWFKFLKSVKLILILFIFIVENGICWYYEVVDYNNIALSPDESKIVFEGKYEDRGSLWNYPVDIFLIEIESKERKLKHLTHSIIGNILLSQDKSKILFETFYGLFMIDLTQVCLPEQVFVRFPGEYFDTRDNEIKEFYFSKDSKQVLLLRYKYGPNQTELCSIDLKTKEIKVLDKLDKYKVKIHEFKYPDIFEIPKKGQIWFYNKTRFITKDKNNIWMYIPSENKKVHLFHDSHSITEVSLLPDDKRIAIISAYQKDTDNDRDKTFYDLKIFDIKKKNIVTVLKEKDEIKDLSPGKNFLAFSLEDIIFIMDYRNYKLEKIIEGEKPIWISEAKFLFIQNGFLCLTNINTKSKKILTIPSGNQPLWFKDSKRVAIRHKDKLYSINIEDWRIKEVKNPLLVERIMEGKRKKVILKKIKHYGPYTSEEIWVKDKITGKTFKVKEEWSNL
jgi:hypothetical protein